MGNDKIIRRAFNAGEVSKRFKYRSDVEKHAYSCEKLENFYVSPLGAISRRKGTKLIGTLGSNIKEDTVRLVPFEYNRDLSLLLVFRSSDKTENYYTCVSSAFKLPDDFSICYTAPKEVAVDMPLIVKGDIRIRFNYSFLTLYYKDEAKLEVAVEQGTTVCLCYSKANKKFSVYCGGKKTSAIQYEVDITDTECELEYNSLQKGDMCRLKILGIDMSSKYAFYTPKDYENDTNNDFMGCLTQAPYRVLRTPIQAVGEDLNYSSEQILHKDILPFLNGSSYGNVHEISQNCSDINSLNVKLGDFIDGYVESTTIYVKGDDVSAKDIDTRGYSTVDINGEGWLNLVCNPSKLSWSDDHTITIENGVKFNADYWDSIMLEYNSYLKYELGQDAKNQHAVNFYNYLYLALGVSQKKIDEIFAYGEDELDLKYFAMQNVFHRFLGMCEIQTGITGVDYTFSTVCIEDIAQWADYPMPLGYDFIVVPCDIPVGAKTIINNAGEPVEVAQFFSNITGNVRLFGVSEDYSQVDTLLDGSHKFDIKHIIFAVPIGNFSGESCYANKIQSQMLSKILLDNVLKWKSNKIVLLDAYDINGNKVQSDVDTQIPVDALHEFQYKQAGGNVYLAHSSFPPTLLKYNGKEFAVESAVKFEPSLDEAEKGLSISLAGASDEVCVSGKNVNITANKDFFDVSMLDMQLQLEYKDEQEKEFKWTHLKDDAKNDPTGNITPAFAVCGEVRVHLEGGIWSGVLVLEESTDNGKTWHEIGRSTSTEGSSNTEIVREIYDPTSLVRVKMLESKYCSTGDGEKIYDYQRGCFFQIIIKGTTSAWAKIVAVESPTKATVELISPCRASFTTKNVYRSAWGGTFGYPRTVEIHEERLTLAGTRNNPATVWLSQTNNWDNFRSVSNLETDPLAYNLASDDGEPISWLVSREDLMIGLGSSEWSLGSRDAGQALTQSIVKASDQSNDGVEYVMPVKVGGMVVYVRRGNCELASISYDFANDSYNSISLTTLNPEILGGGFVSICNQLSPRNNIFALRKDGQVAVFTYDKENNVFAWSRFTFGKGVVSICTLSTGQFRSLFMVVKRGNHLCVERLDANETNEDIWQDCSPIRDIEIEGDIETNSSYQSTIKTTPIFLTGSVRLLGVRLYMINSWGGRLRVEGFDQNGDVAEIDSINIFPRESEFLQPPKARDYRFNGVCDTGYLEEGSVVVETEDAMPFELTAIGIKAKE